MEIVEDRRNVYECGAYDTDSKCHIDITVRSGRLLTEDDADFIQSKLSEIFKILE